MSTANATGGVGVGVVAREVATALAGQAFLEGLRDRTQPAPPFAVETDIWIVEVDSGRVVFEATPSQRFYNPLGTVHGGWISTLLDSAMGCAVHSVLKAGPPSLMQFARDIPCRDRPPTPPCRSGC
jgi:hypothetical protein